MPVENRSGTKQVTSVIFAVVAVLLAIGLAWGMLALASGGDGPVRLRLGDDEFDAGNAVRLSKQISEDGPVLFPDVSGRGQRRPLVVNHFGDDPETRWVAFPATLDSSEKDCFLVWNDAEGHFEDVRVQDGIIDQESAQRCSDTTVEPNGDGLQQFSWKVDDEGRLIIDVRGEGVDPTATGDTTGDDSGD